MSQTSVTLRFEIVRDGDVVRTEQFDQDVIKIGKLGSSHLRLDGDDVSRIHAVIEKDSAGAYSVIDLGSASGTFVNGDKVTKTGIEDGDQLRFGDTTTRVGFVEAADTAGADDAGVAVPDADDSAAAVSTTQTVTLDDGTVVDTYTQLGYHDDQQNYIPYWYDEHGQYQAGYGYYDEAGHWQVAHGYYDADGQWFDGQPAAGGSADAGPSDTEIYQEGFFDDPGGSTLEVAMLWSDHVLAVSTFDGDQSVTIGPADDNDFIVEDDLFGSSIRFPLISVRQGGYYLSYDAQMSGFVHSGDQRYDLQEAIDQGVAKQSSAFDGVYEVRLGSKSRARIDVGDTSFLAHFTQMPTVIGGGLAIDTDPLPYLAFSAVAHGLFWLMAMTLPDDASSLELDGFQANDRFVEMMMEPEQKEKEKPDFLGDQGDEEEAAKHKGDEGEAGKKEEKQEDKRMAIKGPPDNQDMKLKKARDTKVAQNAGVMKVFNSNQVSSMWGKSNSSVGSDAIHALGNLQGDEAGSAKGFGGLGLAGAGRGGGGVSERGIGMANVGTSGRGGGGRGGDGYGKNAADLGKKNNKMPKVIPGKPLVTGSLDKEIIRRVIRKHRREIAYCYEQQLQKNKNLAGRIKVKFTISGTGDVIAAMVRNSTLKNRSVESCVTSKIRRWVFPEPKGNGIVVVNYPFNFTKQ